MASELSANNPDLIESIRRNVGRPQPGGDNNNPTPDNGNDNGSAGPFDWLLVRHMTKPRFFPSRSE